MIIDLSNDKRLEIEGNKARVLPNGIWHQFGIDEDKDISITVASEDIILFKYGDDTIIASIRGNIIAYEGKE